MFVLDPTCMYVLCVGFHDPWAEPTQHITPTDGPRIEGKGGKDKTPSHTRSHFGFGTLRPGGETPTGVVCKYRYSTAQKLDGHGAPADDTIWSVLVFRSIPTVYYTVVVVTLDKNYVPMSQL